LLGSTNAIARLAQHRRRLARVTAGHGHAPFAQANNYLQKTNKMADGWHQGSVSAGVPSLPGHRSIDREASRRDDLHRVFRPHVHGYHALNQGDVMSVYGTAISTILHDEATEVVVSGGAAKFTTVRRRPTMIASRHALGRSVKMPPWRTNCHAVPTTGPIRDVRHEASKIASVFITEEQGRTTESTEKALMRFAPRMTDLREAPNPLPTQWTRSFFLVPL
jgi:hypothetical protein